MAGAAVVAVGGEDVGFALAEEAAEGFTGAGVGETGFVLVVDGGDVAAVPGYLAVGIAIVGI